MAASSRFRTALFGGYKPEDVIAFITEENRRFTAEKTALEDKVAALQAKADESDANARAAAEAKAALEAKETLLDGILADQARLKSELAEVQQKFEQLSLSCTDLEKEKTYLVEMEMDARRRVDDAEAASNRRLEQVSAAIREKMGTASQLLSSFSATASPKLEEALRNMTEYADMLKGLGASFDTARAELMQELEGGETVLAVAGENPENAPAEEYASAESPEAAEPAEAPEAPELNDIQ